MLTVFLAGIKKVNGYFNADPHPGNILVQVRDGHAVPVLLDFGMTKVLDDKTRLSFAQVSGALYCILITHHS